MDSFLDRYISFEYLVSPCPQSGRGPAEPGSLAEARVAVERARQELEMLRSEHEQDEKSKAIIVAIESELTRAIALLEHEASKSWLS